MGLYYLHRLHSSQQNALLTILIGIVIVATALVNIFRPNKTPGRDARPLLAPALDHAAHGAEVGFSSAAAAAIGTLALLNLKKLTPAQVVGADVLFGLALSLLGGGFQMAVGSYDGRSLKTCPI